MPRPLASVVTKKKGHLKLGNCKIGACISAYFKRQKIFEIAQSNEKMCSFLEDW